jgi:Leucine-rich repeat (LRR) protein
MAKQSAFDPTGQNKTKLIDYLTVDHHLEKIGKLVHLRYLSLRGCEGIFHLPDSLGNLKQLQTLDITRTRIIKLQQAIIKLSKLQHVRAGGPYHILSSSGGSYDEILLKLSDSNKLSMWMWTATLMDFCFSICGRKFLEGIEGDSNRRDLCTFYWCVVLPIMARLADPFAGIVVPRGIGKLKDLHTLGTVNISRGNLKAILQDIKRLTRLHKLAVTGINKKNCQEFCSTLAHLSRLESLSVCS